MDVFVRRLLGTRAENVFVTHPESVPSNALTLTITDNSQIFTVDFYQDKELEDVTHLILGK